MFLDQYIKIKDKYCLCYFGHEKSYLQRLKYLRPLIEKEFEGIEIYLASNEKLYHIIENEPRTLQRSQLTKKEKSNYGYIRELKQSLKEPKDIVTEFLKESDLCYLESKIPIHLCK